MTASDDNTEESTSMTATAPVASEIIPHLSDLPDAKEAARQAAERKADAKKHFDEIVNDNTEEGLRSMRIGWNAAYLKRNSLFGILGFRNEHEARVAAGVGESTWYANIRLAEAFSDLDKEQFCSMKQANARALSDLPESKRKSREWVRWAGSMKIESFQDKCDDAMEGKARRSDGKERGVVIRMPMPKSRKRVIETGLREYATSVGISEDDPGKALELMVAEKTGHKTLIGAITTATQLIRQAKKLQKQNLSADELVEKVFWLLDEMALEFKAALDAAKNEMRSA